MNKIISLIHIVFWLQPVSNITNVLYMSNRRIECVSSQHRSGNTLHITVKGLLHGHSQRRWWVDHSPPPLLNALSTHNLCCYCKGPSNIPRRDIWRAFTIATQVMSGEEVQQWRWWVSTHHRLCEWPCSTPLTAALLEQCCDEIHFRCIKMMRLK